MTEPKIETGTLADSVAVQLRKQRLKYEKDTIKSFQTKYDAVTTLRIHDFITRPQAIKIRTKITKALYYHLKKYNPTRFYKQMTRV